MLLQYFRLFICQQKVPLIIVFGNGHGNAIIETPIQSPKFVGSDGFADIEGEISDGLAKMAISLGDDTRGAHNAH